MAEEDYYGPTEDGQVRRTDVYIDVKPHVDP